MASRYLKAAVPQAQSVYTPMPLEFINETLTADQGKYDTAESQLAAASSLKQEMSPWAEEQGYRDKLMQQYLPKIEELTNQLHRTGEVEQVTPLIAKLNQQWTNDPLRNKLAKDYEFYDKTYLPFTKEEGYSTAYDEYKTKEGSWNPNIDIDKSSSYKRVLWDKDADIHKNIDNWMASSYAKLTGADGAKIEYVDGTPMLVESKNGKIEKKGIDLKDPLWRDLYASSIEGLADQYSTQPSDVGLWMQNKVGDKEAIKNYITNIARFKFFNQQDLIPGNENYTQLHNSGDGSGSGSTKDGDFVYTIQPIGLGEVGPETYLNISQNVEAFEQQQLGLEQDILKQSGDIINSFTDQNGYNPLKEKILKEANVKGLNSIDAIRQGLNIAQQYYNDLPEGSPEKLKLQGQIVRIGDAIKSYDRLNLNKEFLADYKNHIDTEVSGKYLKNQDNLSKVDKFIDGTLSDSFIGSLDNIDVKRTKKSSDITLEQKGELVNLIKQYESNGRYLNGNNEVIEDKILNLLGIESSGDKSFVLGNLFAQMEGVGGYDKLASSITQYSKDPSVYTGIKFNPNRLTISQDAGLDTNIEEWNKGLNESYKNGTISSIAGALNMSVEDFIKSSVSFDSKKAPSVKDLKDFKFDNIEMVDIGSVPTAMYTFTKGDGKEKFSVVAPLTATNNKVVIQDAAIDLWNKGLGKDQTAMNMAARMMATSALDEDQYSQLLYMFKLNQPDNANPFTLNIKNLPIKVSKVGKDQYSIQATNSQGQTSSIVVNGEEDVLTAIGTTALNNLSSGGNSNGMGKGTTWVPGQ